MSVSQQYPFNDQADYNISNIQVTGGLAKLALVTEAGNTFNQGFAADTGFTYNAALAEFTAGLLRQKDQRPSNQSFFCDI